jgi:hypothetical protein
VAAEQIEVSEELRPRWWPMIGLHAGLITVIFGAIYTVQVPGAVGRMEWAGYAAVGVALVLVGGVKAWDVRSPVGRGLLALGGAIALYLAYDPQLVGLPGGAALLESPVGELQPSLAHVGIVVAGVFLALQAVVDRRLLPAEVSFRASVLAAVLLLVGLTVVMWLGLRGVYDLSMTVSPAFVIFRTVAYGLLMFVCLTVPGVRAVARAPHIYLGLALLGAVVRNMMVS